MTHLATFVMVFASIAPALTGSLTLVVAQSPNVELSENARAPKSPSDGNVRDLMCVFDATIETLADEAGLRSEPKTENRDLIIALSDDYFAVTGSFSTMVGSGMPTTADDHNTRVYDFTDRVLRNIDLNEKCYYESTLYASVHFRVSELMHRKGTLAALDSGGISKSSLGGPTTDFGLETMFGLLTPASRLQLKSPRLRDGSYEYTHENVVVLAYQSSQHAIPESLQRTFRRLLSYEFPIHPTIRRRVTKQRHLPQEMMIRYVSDAGTREVNLRLKSVVRQSRPDGSHPPPQYELVRSYVPEVRELLDTLAKRPVPSPKDARRAAGGFVDASIRERRYVDGVLACLELSFQTGDANYSNQLINRVRQAAGRDAKTMQFFDAIGRDSRAIRKVRESPRFVGYKKLHVLDYLLGDKLLAEGAADEAYRSLKTALAGNPWLVGAYVDLGRIQMGQFDSPSAWELFQAAKQIAPAHPDLVPIRRLEEQLENDFPDHF